ncbi:hypothetical protein ACH5RR_036746 [Cinchona calisaya]|uniref:NAC domain-containing protein n=1 Tax=Cinchona calisaya TaxID=153742 RepID=A0ABD2Y789_9GENT
MAGPSIPYGYRFDPNDEELMGYLKKKIFNENTHDVIPEANIYDVKPDDLPFDSFRYAVESIWYFYTIKPNSLPMTGDGYWSPIAEVDIRGQVKGFKKELVYYQHPRQMTCWYMHEYRLHPDILAGVALDAHQKAEVISFLISSRFT